LELSVSSPGDSDTQAPLQTFATEKVNVRLVKPADSASIVILDELAAAHQIPVVIVDVGPTSGHTSAVVRANNLTTGAHATKCICCS
jgi:ABC-type sugar transport system substrate-binding protein